MIVIWPIPVTAADVVQNPEDLKTYPLWDPAKVYPANSRVSTVDGRVWESPFTKAVLPDSTELVNVGNDPTTQTGFFLPYGSRLTPTLYLRPNPNHLHFWWVGLSSGETVEPENENQFKLLYQPLYRQTVGQGEIRLLLKPTRPFNSAALFNLEADSVTLTLGAYSRTRSTAFPSLAPGRRKEVAFLDLPEFDPSGADALEVVISGQGEVKCGYLSIGVRCDIGTTAYGTALEITDYSHKSRDVFGNMSIVKRDYSNRISYENYADSSHVAQIRRLLSQLRTVPAAYVARDNVEETLVFGFYQDFAMPIQPYTYSDLTVVVEGLV